MRQLKGLERAEMVMDQMELKVQKSMGRLHSIKERRKDWDNVNSRFEAGGMFGALFDLREDKSDRDATKANGNKENNDEKEKAIAENATPLQLAFRPPRDVPGSRAEEQTIEDDADNVE